MTTALLEYPGLSKIVAIFAEWEISISEETLRKISDIINPVSLRSLTATPPNPKTVATAWKAALDHSSIRGEPAWIVLLLFFVDLLNKNHPLSWQVAAELGKQKTPAGKPLSLSGSWFEANRRLASNLYHLGRIKANPQTNRLLLLKCVEILDFLFAADKAAVNPSIRSKYAGMRGVAHLLLARGETDAHERYEAAVRDLEESRSLGDDSVEHDLHLIDACIHLFDLSEDRALLLRVDELLSGLEGKTDRRELPFYVGEVALRNGFHEARQGNLGEALKLFRNADSSFTRAINLPPSEQVSDEYLRTKRGQARLRLYTTTYSLFGRRDDQMLNAAIEDLPTGGISLPAALLLRSRAYREREEYSVALEDLERARAMCGGESSEELTLKDRISAGIGECLIRIGEVEHHSALIRDGLELLLSLPATLQEVNLAALVYGVRYLASALPLSDLEELVEKTVSNIKLRLEIGELQGGARSFAASHAASLLFLLASDSDKAELLERAYFFQREALAALDSPVDADLYSSAGRIALQLGKIHIKRGQSEIGRGFLEDAFQWFSASIDAAREERRSESFLEVVAYSRLGEACARLNALTGQVQYAHDAIEYLMKARSLGNESAELIGLVGDAFYRRGRARRDVRDLLEAVQLKSLARERGHISRENRSVSGAAWMLVWELTGSSEALGNAVEAICEALSADPRWPWPYFQLAELASLPESIREEAVRNTNSELPEAQLVRLGNASELFSLGCMKAIETDEFAREILGGRSAVYVLNDPHRLLSQSFVFKHSSRNSAKREIGVVEDFGEFLRSVGAPEYFSLPEPLITLPFQSNPEAVVYVMRRAAGRQLGELVVDWRRGRENAPLSYFRKSLEFLAYFHLWGQRLGKMGKANRTLSQAVEKTVDLWSAIGLPLELRKMLYKRLMSCVPDGLPGLLKKDAHPENWLIAGKDRVIMLDLENTAELPLMFEVAQLLEDYPLLDADAASWLIRAEMYKEYLHVMEAFGVKFPEESIISAAYSAFALFRAAFGLGRLNKKLIRQSLDSSSAIHASALRKSHYLSLIQFLGVNGATPEVQECAKLIEVCESKLAAP